MKQAAPSSEGITEERVRTALIFSAYVVEKYGVAYAPIMERLEKELEIIRAKEDPVSRARRILHAHTSPGTREITLSAG